MTKQVVSGTTTTTYYGTDHLGTVRATATFTSGGTYQGYTLQDYEPYGMEIPPRDTTSTNTHKYTGHERDVLNAAPGSYYANDYMHFRGYATNVGRFLRGDSVGGVITSPETWNGYSYVLGNPVRLLDPTGHSASGGYVGTETAPPGAYPDNGETPLSSAGLLPEGMGTIGSAIPDVIHVGVNVIVDPKLDSKKAEQYAKTQVGNLNRAYWKYGIDFKINSIATGRLGRHGVRSWNATLSMIRLPRLSGSS